jgi:hypothetical protein
VCALLPVAAMAAQQGDRQRLPDGVAADAKSNRGTRRGHPVSLMPLR